MKRMRLFVVGRCHRKSRAMWLLQRTDAPIAGPFTLCAVVSPR
jgi:hypothetical protein